jgi:hypothetical protein
VMGVCDGGLISWFLGEDGDTHLCAVAVVFLCLLMCLTLFVRDFMNWHEMSY